MIRHPLVRATMDWLEGMLGNRESLLRGSLVLIGGILLMFSCLTILTLSSCTFAP
jgi:hypothetical protein